MGISGNGWWGWEEPDPHPQPIPKQREYKIHPLLHLGSQSNWGQTCTDGLGVDGS